MGSHGGDRRSKSFKDQVDNVQLKTGASSLANGLMGGWSSALLLLVYMRTGRVVVADAEYLGFPLPLGRPPLGRGGLVVTTKPRKSSLGPRSCGSYRWGEVMLTHFHCCQRHD
jgi:hypothetical protein